MEGTNLTEPGDRNDTQFYTIGYGGLNTAQELKDIMDQDGIEILMDVRANPFSRRFHQKTLLNILGDRYRSRPEMGGFDHEVSQYHEWCDVAAEGLGQLITMAEQDKKVIIMCAEKDPDKCHRKYFVARALEESGYGVTHL